MQFAVASALVQTTTHQPATIVVLLYLKFPFELHSSQLLLRSYRQPLTNQALPARHNRMLHQPAVIKVSLGADSSSLKVAGLHSDCGSKHSLSPTVCLNYTVICKYPINTELYLNFSKYIDESLVAKSLTNILKFTYFNIYFP